MEIIYCIIVYVFLSLFIIDGPQSVTIHPPETTMTVEEGAIIPPITCIADCYPNCTIQWIITTKSENITRTGALLNLQTANRDDDGTYRCVAIAKNPIPPELRRRESVSVNISVQCKCYIVYHV